ncbi:hypothetical protein BK011_06680 [Tenericutes bacterium MZ-XQ]|nr:hypothetical protein BK011_06680 [Tenericutes bacterium MZ-XQ]
MPKTKEIEFSIKNVKYAVRNSDGSYGAVQDLAYAEGIALESTYSSTHVYGDGQIICEITSDKGLTGNLILVQMPQQYEIDMKRKMLIDGGVVADITQRDSVEHAIYFEVSKLLDGVVQTKKVWILNVTSGKASETHTQSKDSVNLNNIEIPLTILGEKMMDNLGAAVYKDTNGNDLNVTKMSVVPGDADYATFEAAVPVPKMAA